MSLFSFLAPTTPTTPAGEAGEAARDPYNLDRFIKAQDQNNAFDEVLAAFRGGHRKPHPAITWMWFVFPQMDHCQTQSLRARISSDGLSYEDVDEHRWRRRDVWPAGHALSSLDEARAYLRHPILGERARQAATTVLESPFADKFALMDNIPMDVARLHSSMTVLRQAARFPRCIHDRREDQLGENRVFAQVINRFFVRFAHRDEEGDWLDQGSRALMARKPGSRHKPTLQCLEEEERVAIQRRAKEGAGCVCGHGKEEVLEMDRASKRKMDDSRGALEAEKRRKRQRREQKRKEKGKSAADGKDAASADGKAPATETNNQAVNPQLPALDSAPTGRD
ncbi:hypothetical protein KVR01_009108 [Diaporthe batatas]|uniref:uncharacterized protein n=1 Tax=Diaporthe batatas TaxID=748121 RepID=UPI001D045D5D|nr:uncharacterized protein KVR01_009108 [Diaporthe batatas]KAG8160844.1 hypothetical protein KVR01_009108 [Diaporthe batatas]